MFVGGLLNSPSDFRAQYWPDRRWKLPSYRMAGAKGIYSGAVKCVEIEKNTTDYIFCLTHTDTEKQKLWERMRLESLVVIAVNDEYRDPTRRISTKKKKTIELIMFDRVEMVIWIIQEQIQLRIIIKIK